MSLSKLRGNENIADVVSLEPYADIDQIRETLINVIRWLGDREPVAPGDVFLKFATYGGLVDLGLVTTQELLTNEDNPGDGNDPAAPEELYVEFYAKDMTPSVTAGCSTLQVVETASANPNLHFLAFDPSTNESCDFVAILPAGWTGGTFQFRIYWSHGFGSVAWNTVWELQANSYKTGETLARVLVPGTLVRGTGGAVDGLYITNESDPVYISGELNSPGNLVLLRITRKATDALDTLTVDARLHAIRFNLGSAPVDYPPTVPDPYWANVVLLVQGGTASPVQDLSTYASTAAITSGIAFDNTHQVFGVNPLRPSERIPSLASFTSTGPDTRFTRPSGMAYTIEVFAYWTSLDNVGTHFFFLWDDGVGSRVMELGFSGSSGNLRLRINNDSELLTGNLAANTLWYIQLTISGNTYYLDAGAVPGDGTTTQRSTGTAPISNAAGTNNFRVGTHYFPDSTASSGGLWISPLRVTRGVARARGSVPTAAFPTF